MLLLVVLLKMRLFCEVLGNQGIRARATGFKCARYFHYTKYSSHHGLQLLLFLPAKRILCAKQISEWIGCVSKVPPWPQIRALLNMPLLTWLLKFTSIMLLLLVVFPIFGIMQDYIIFSGPKMHIAVVCTRHACKK